MTALELIVITFTTWRVSYMVTNEEGPWRVFFHLKNTLGAYDLDDKGAPRTWVGRGIICMYCVSAWVGLFFSLPLLAKWELGWSSLALPFAVSAGALYLHRLIKRE